MNNPRSELLSRRPRTGFPVKDEALFLTHLPVIDAAIKTVCRRNHLSPSDADDFASDVRLRLLERGGAPFERRSALRDRRSPLLDPRDNLDDIALADVVNASAGPGLANLSAKKPSDLAAGAILR